MDSVAESLQWPGMITNVVGAWLMTSPRKGYRHIGFWLFLVSATCWLIWGIHVRSWALVVLQVALAALNIRGLFKTKES